MELCPDDSENWSFQSQTRVTELLPYPNLLNGQILEHFSPYYCVTIFSPVILFSYFFLQLFPCNFIKYFYLSFGEYGFDI